MSIDLLGEAMNSIKTHEMAGLEECTVRSSKLVADVLRILKANGYVKSYEFIDDGKGGKYDVKLGGFINNCGVIKPRLPVKRTDWAKVEQRFIPGVGIGLVIVSTSVGIITNREAAEKLVGGRLLAFVY